MTSLLRRSLQRASRRSLLTPSPIFRPFSSTFVRRQELAEEPVPETTLNDAPVLLAQDEEETFQIDWSRSFHGLSTQPFDADAAKVLTAPIDPNDVEIKPGPPLTT
jgi:Mitochondrial genome maintenance MGM101